MDETAIVTLEHCPLCGGAHFRALPVPGHWIGPAVFGPYQGRLGLCRCRRCGFRFVNPRPARHLLDQFYGGDDYSCHRPDDAAGPRRRADALLALLARHTAAAPGKTLLDFGCGGGLFLSRAVHAGWDAVGFDVGRRSLESCAARGLRATDRLADLPAGRFDVITLNHVFEHLENHAEVLASLKALLAPAGKLLIEVPNCRSLRARLSLPVLSRHFQFDERFRAFPIHLSYFTRATLGRVLRQNGWDVEWITTVGFGLEELLLRPEPVGPPATVGVEADGGQNRAEQGTAERLAKGVIKKTFFGLGLGENLLALAQVSPGR